MQCFFFFFFFLPRTGCFHIQFHGSDTVTHKTSVWIVDKQHVRTVASAVLIWEICVTARKGARNGAFCLLNKTCGS